MGNVRTLSTLGDAVNHELDDEYTLVYASQGDTLPDDFVAALVNGSNEYDTKGGDALMERESNVRWDSSCEIVDELAEAIVRRWERQDDAEYQHLIDDWVGSEQRESAIFTVQDRDTSTWITDVINLHGAILLRVQIRSMDEDAGLSFTPITPEQFLDLLGFPHVVKNLELAAEVIDNASPEFGVAIGQALIGIDLAEIVGLPCDGEVELRNPHVWLGNQFMGSGWCSEDAFAGTLAVERSELRTDNDAFGWSWNQVVGGTHASYYSGEIAAVTVPLTPNQR
jgi:hypothetical protein